MVKYKNKLFPETQTIMEAKNKYNRKHVLFMKNGAAAVDTHHLLPQNMANKNGIIEHGFHKNHLANTQTLCKKCIKKKLRKTKRSSKNNKRNNSV